VSSNLVRLPASTDLSWIDAYEQACLTQKNMATVDAYRRILRQFTQWVAERPGHHQPFHPEQLTITAVETYLSELQGWQYSVSHCMRVKSVLRGFCQWLIDEQGVLKRNPVRAVKLNAAQMLAPRVLSSEQRYVFPMLIEGDDDVRGSALFALGYWAGCRVSDLAHLLMDHAHIGPKIGWLRVGHKGAKFREIDLLNQARRPLRDYLQHGGRDQRLTEAGIHHWFRCVKARASREQWELIGDITFHDLRHDFAHRAREAGWTLEELAYYLGHITNKGTPAIQTTARNTQVSREQVKAKLAFVKG